MSLIIKTYEGVGDIKFGDSVETVRKILNSRYKSFKKTPMSEFPTDAFEDLGMHIYYKKSGLCEAIEMFEPANPSINHYEIIGEKFNEVMNWISQQDKKIDIDENGLTSFKLGIGIYAPGHEEDENAKVEAVIAFETGYYD